LGNWYLKETFKGGLPWKIPTARKRRGGGGKKGPKRGGKKPETEHVGFPGGMENLKKNEEE